MAFLLNSMIITVGPSSQRTLAPIPNTTITKLVSIKIVIILVIFCYSIYQNNRNYIPLLLALYIYSAGARVDTIILLNHLDLLVSYNVLQKKLKDITGSIISSIKVQRSNSGLIGFWDNFELCENIYGK